MTEKIAVVGGTGFLGSNLVLELLQAGYAPVVVARTPQKLAKVLPGIEVELRSGDVTKPDSLIPALQGCAVVHSVAALLNQVFTAPSRHLEEQAVQTNAQGTLNVLRAARDVGARRVVLAGTCSTRYQPGGVLANEDSPPTTPRLASDAYVRSKLLAEAAADKFSRETGLPVVNLLPGGLIGPGDCGLSPLQVGVLESLNGARYPAIEGAFPVVDVRDVARAHVAAMEVESPANAYLLVEQTIPWRDWSALQTRLTGVPGPTTLLSPRVAMVLAFVAEVSARARRKPALFTRNAVRHLMQNQQYDCSRAERELGISFTPIETSLRDAIVWFIENGHVTQPERFALVAEARGAA